MSVLYDYIFCSPRLCTHNGAAIFQRCSVNSSVPLGLIVKSETQRAQALHCMRPPRPPLNDSIAIALNRREQGRNRISNLKIKIAQAAGCPDMK